MQTPFKLMTCQLALFIREGNVRSDEFSFELSKNMDIGSYEPMLIPEAPGMPPEFPRLQISTPKGYQLTLSRVRVDFLITLPLGLEASEVNHFHSQCKKLLKILDERNFKYSRVGYIHNYFATGQSVIESFIKKATPFRERDFFELSLSVTEHINVSNWVCNSLYSFSSAFTAFNEPGLFAVRDLNTAPDKDYILTKEDIEVVLETAPEIVNISSINQLVG